MAITMNNVVDYRRNGYEYRNIYEIHHIPNCPTKSRIVVIGENIHRNYDIDNDVLRRNFQCFLTLSDSMRLWILERYARRCCELMDSF